MTDNTLEGLILPREQGAFTRADADSGTVTSVEMGRAWRGAVQSLSVVGEGEFRL